MFRNADKGVTTTGGPDTQAVWDVVIVGAGPAGMAAALYTGRARLRTLLLDRIPGGGGQLLNTDLIEDYPGVVRTTGQELATTFGAQINAVGVEVTWGDVVRVEARGRQRVVITDGGVRYMTRTVIVATGGSPRKLGIPGEPEFEGRGVSYCAICDGPLFQDKTLVVVGGGDSAVEEADFLTRYARQVFIVHRGDRWRAQKPAQRQALDNPKIVPLWNATIEEIGGAQTVEWVGVRNGRTGEVARLEVDGVFIYVGFRPSSDILGGLAQRDERGFAVTDEKMQTALPGVFVAGDVRRQYLRQISNAVGDATTSAVAATRYIEALDATGAGEELPA
jgi:thioredoxin reductase (NADPH)